MGGTHLLENEHFHDLVVYCMSDGGWLPCVTRCLLKYILTYSVQSPPCSCESTFPEVIYLENDV